MSSLVGLLWDKYTPAVEAQITRDLIMLQSVFHNITVTSDKDDADRLLSALGIQRIPFESVAKAWVVYRTSEESQLEAPLHATNAVIRDMFQEKTEGVLNLDKRSGYYLKDFGRTVPNRISRLRMPTGKPPLEPWLALLY